MTRAGSRTRYSWGNEFDATKVANGSGAEPVGSYTANAFGLYNMQCNIWEWVEDRWNGNYIDAPTDGSAWAGGNCYRRVLSGGSWFYVSWFLRAAARFGLGIGKRYFILVPCTSRAGVSPKMAKQRDAKA